MTNPFRRRASPGATAAGRRFAALACALASALSNAAAAPADPAHGEQLAKRWCASCHIVSPEQAHGADNAPAFATIAKIPGFSSDKIAKFLMDPHPKMPDMQLGRDEAKDLGAYIASLAQ
jgi:mono/diheme cytochrome c family protein